MKTAKTLALLLLLAATGNSAKAQATYVAGCKSYTFSSASAAVGSGTITYQWYRNSVAISGANSASYTLPAKKAYGENVEFKRGVISSNCAGEVTFSNAYVISFSGLIVDTLCWAHTNVDSYQTFALIPDMYTKFYQWNRTTAWAATGAISGWNSTADNSNSWTTANNPCPTGWRLPSLTEFCSLENAGSTWVAAGTRGAAVAGRFYGSNHATAVSCTLPNNMTNCVFLPAVGNRIYNSGALSSQGYNGYYCSGEMYGYSPYIYVHYLRFNNGNSYANSIEENYDHKALGYSIRCVR